MSTKKNSPKFQQSTGFIAPVIAFIVVLVLLAAFSVILSSRSQQNGSQSQLGSQPQQLSQISNSPSTALQTPNPGWPKYSSPKYRFSILYPPGWFIHEDDRTPDVGPLIDFTPTKSRKPGQIDPEIWVEIVTKPSSQQLT